MSNRTPSISLDADYERPAGRSPVLWLLCGVLILMVIMHFGAGFGGATSCTSEPGALPEDCDSILVLSRLGMIVAGGGALLTGVVGLGSRRAAYVAFLLSFVLAGLLLMGVVTA